MRVDSPSPCFLRKVFMRYDLWVDLWLQLHRELCMVSGGLECLGAAVGRQFSRFGFAFTTAFGRAEPAHADEVVMIGAPAYLPRQLD
jgi:hypothetical protein